MNVVPQFNFSHPQTIGSLGAGTIFITRCRDIDLWHHHVLKGRQEPKPLQPDEPKPPHRQATSRSQSLST